MKQLMFVVALVSAAVWAGPADASWMGEAWLEVKIERVEPHVEGTSERGVQLRVLRWERSAGHSDTFGKDLPGERFEVQLRMESPAQAAGLKAGVKARVKYRLASYMKFDPKTGRRVGGSSKRWTYVGGEGGGTLIEEAPPVKRAQERPKRSPPRAP